MTRGARGHHSGDDVVDGSAPGYRAGATLPVRVELARQLRRRRTQLTLGFLVLLPVLLWLAFTLGGDDGEGTSLIDLATASAANFVVFTLLSSAGFLLVVVVALFFGDTVASEASWSSLRYLLAAPVPRGRLLRQKAVVAALLSAFALLLLLPATATVVGLLAYGAGDLISPTGQSLAFAPAMSRLALAPVYLGFHLAWVAGLALLLSVSTDAPLGAVGGAVLLSILSQILDTISALGDLRDFLPTHYTSAWAELLAVPIDWTDMASGTLSGLGYATVFGLLAWRRFATKDITS